MAGGGFGRGGGGGAAAVGVAVVESVVTFELVLCAVLTKVLLCRP